MASLSPSIPMALSNLLLSNSSHLPTLKHRRVGPKVSCKSSRNTNNEESQNKIDYTIMTNKLDRRNMLIGLGGLYGAANVDMVSRQQSALASPTEPDVTKCNVTDESGGGMVGLECCPPPINKIMDFKIENYPSPSLRVRPPIEKAYKDKKYMRKLEEAIYKMKALPATDPRNFYQQANVHCAYCDGAYRQLGFPDIDYLVHASWLFFPFHRAYLYFFERILGKLIDDPSFAMPYWNWDHPDGMRFPEAYARQESKFFETNPLFDPYRDPNHLPPKLVDLNYHNVDLNIPDDVQKEFNLWYMYSSMVRATRPQLFFGSPLFAGDPTQEDTGAGSIENIPHNCLHFWCGDPRMEYRRDMGAFFSAARDPIFYAHHSNVDRMWSIWNTLGIKGRPNFDKPDWLNTYFILYDENAQPIRIYTRDILDHRKLGYDYQPKDLPWLKPPKPAAKCRKKSRSTPLAGGVTLPKPLDSAVRIKIRRPRMSRSKEEKEEQEEVLVVKVDVIKETEFIKFDVFVNDDEDYDLFNTYQEKTLPGIEFLGSFVNLPHKPKPNMKMRKAKSLRLPLNECLEDLGADNDEIIDVVLVPRSGKGDVILKDVKIEYLT